MSLEAILGLYAVNHVVVTGVRAFARLKKIEKRSPYYYPAWIGDRRKYLNCLKNRVGKIGTFAYSAGFTGVELLLYYSLHK